jgi:hypothetical protein
MFQKKADIKSGRNVTCNTAVVAAADGDDDDDDDDRRTSCYKDEGNTKSLGRAYCYIVTHKMSGNSSNP